MRTLPTHHNIFDKDYLGIIVADQHQPAKIPAYNGECIATIRLQNMSLGQPNDFSLYQLVKAVENDCPARCQEGHGASEVLQRAVNLKLDIYLFFSSGTGLVTDQVSGTSFQIQRALELMSWVVSNDPLSRW